METHSCLPWISILQAFWWPFNDQLGPALATSDRGMMRVDAKDDKYAGMKCVWDVRHRGSTASSHMGLKGLDKSLELIEGHSLSRRWKNSAGLLAADHTTFLG